MPLTLEERERRAYIDGHVELADALAELAEQILCTDNRVGELEEEVADLNKQIEKLDQQCQDWEAEVEAAEMRIAEADRIALEALT